MASPPPQPALPPSSHRTWRRAFPHAAELERRLRAAVRGEVRFDPAARALYATDASNYRQIPIGVVCPRDAADVEAAVAAARALGAPLLARGAGTSLAGQACNAALVLDFSRHMGRLLALDPSARRARVEPGIVLDRVREAAEAHRLTFAPDPATHSRCTLGGMIGNNSCGVHALMGGKTVDNIAALDVLLYDGTRLRLGPMPPDARAAVIAQGGRFGAIVAGLEQLATRYAPLIRARFPQIPRRVSGYNLDWLLPENGFHLARALVGSEGTCVTVLEAELELVPSPPCRRLLALGFPDVFTAADHVPAILESRPIGLEGFDAVLTQLMHAKGLLVDDLALLPPGGGILLAEFGAWTGPELDAQIAAFTAAAAVFPHPPALRAYTEAEAARVWRIRESGLGATAFVPGRANGWEGWEDAAVAPDKLGAYLRGLKRLMDEYGYSTPMYGHYGQGCVHMRIDFDLESAPGIRAFRQFLDRAADLVLAHGGSISGEHGDGQARGALLPKMFGPELMQAFRDFKRLWDPDGTMNPGKLLDAAEPHADLRYGADYAPQSPPTRFAFAADGGSLARAASRCVGVGLCRKESGGVMCPSYMATRAEEHSPRGRAHLLWELLQNEVLPGGWENEQVKEALDLCLSCKACKSECPVSVDIASYKAEFLSHYYESRPRPLFMQAFSRLDRLARAGALAPGLAAFTARLAEPALKRLLGVHPARRLPRLRRPFTRFGEPPAGSGPPVLLFADTFSNYFHPSALATARAVLVSAGFRVRLAPRPICCGRPLYDAGRLDLARHYLEGVLDALAPELDAGVPIVLLEPGCASVVHDELLNLLPRDPRAARLREQSLLFASFLRRHAPEWRPPAVTGKLLVHPHCHQRALQGLDDDVALLRSTGAEVELLDPGCCGMACPFGFERQTYALSQRLGERVLLPRVRAAAPATRVVANGFSCREQIAQGAGRSAFHLAEILARPSETETP
jgi:FAD/FMN-containing dehydrogenase/Fe-S oxidoreductase